MRNLLDDYKEVKDCIYKGETYSVRDNGAVLRHSRIGKRVRKEDDIWTFGKANEQTGYMIIGGERVHRIVAYAFLGEPPTPQHVVDHIDTNRRNNRPQNLRWLTKLENVLLNPITRKRIEFLCGSIEAFINDPSIIQEFANDNPNFAWMRTVSAEEAKASYERLKLWAETPSAPTSTNNGTMGEWIYASTKRHEHIEPFSKYSSVPSNQSEFSAVEYKQDILTESLSPTAMQKYWRTPTEFPLCPIRWDEEPLETYSKVLKKVAIVTKNEYSTHYIDDFALKGNSLLIRTHADDGIKKFSLITVSFEGDKYIHEGQTFFEEQGARKAFTLAQGLEWDGEDGIDDYC